MIELEPHIAEQRNYLWQDHLQHNPHFSSLSVSEAALLFTEPFYPPFETERSLFCYELHERFLVEDILSQYLLRAMIRAVNQKQLELDQADKFSPRRAFDFAKKYWKVLSKEVGNDPNCDLWRRLCKLNQSSTKVRSKINEQSKFIKNLEIRFTALREPLLPTQKINGKVILLSPDMRQAPKELCRKDFAHLNETERKIILAYKAGDYATVRRHATKTVRDAIQHYFQPRIRSSASKLIGKLSKREMIPRISEIETMRQFQRSLEVPITSDKAIIARMLINLGK